MVNRDFILHNISDRAAYIAIALSNDDKMGKDSAIECVIENGVVSVFTSVTQAAPNDYGARRNDVSLKLYFLHDLEII